MSLTPRDNTPPLAGREADRFLTEGLRIVRERSDTVLNAVDDGIYVLDSAGHTVFANEAAVRLLGYTLREMLGRSQHELIHHSYADGTAFPVEACPIFHALRDGVHGRVGGDVFWRRDGTPLVVDFTASPIREGRVVVGAVVTFRDASVDVVAREQAAQLERERAALRARDRALAEARASRELFEQLFEHVPAAVSMTQGPEHRIVLANALARRLVGGRPMVGLTVAEAFPELAGHEGMALRDRVFATGEPLSVHGMVARWDRDGTGQLHEGVFDVRYVAVRDADANVTGVLSFATELPAPGGAG